MDAAPIFQLGSRFIRNGDENLFRALERHAKLLFHLLKESARSTV